MKKILFCALAAFCLMACNQNEPTNTKKDGETISLDGRIYYCLQTGEEYDVEYYLKFDSPNNNMVTDSTTTKWYVEPTSIDNTPFVWNYTVSEGIIKFERNGTSIDAIYSNDTVYFMQKAYVRLLH